MLFISNIGLILIPIVIVQYTMAITCLLMLVKMRFSEDYNISSVKFWVWNLTILLIIGVGFIAFLLCRLICPKLCFGKKDK